MKRIIVALIWLAPLFASAQDATKNNSQKDDKYLDQLNVKIAKANKENNWNDVARFEFEKIDKYGMDTTAMGRGFFNNMVYSTVFKNVEDTAVLRKAADLMNYVNELEKHDNWTYIDTYASLLYKAGKKNAALAAETKAADVAKRQGKTNDVQFCMKMIERMKRNELIWKDLK
ncbi:hypothetical protein [Pedobacter sp. JY14-1]|uniref:hypothetical protein n=1 Tax=Pedobacter sp. JY14-1 TaxID=3034151 RepID=UPI0023E0EDC9|nr:hypothetical protein [Pedobacter sp. JY14-1]